MNATRTLSNLEGHRSPPPNELRILALVKNAVDRLGAQDKNHLEPRCRNFARELARYDQAPPISCFARGPIDSSSNKTIRDLERATFFSSISPRTHSVRDWRVRKRPGWEGFTWKEKRGERNFDLLAVASTDLDWLVGDLSSVHDFWIRRSRCCRVRSACTNPSTTHRCPWRPHHDR